MQFISEQRYLVRIHYKRFSFTSMNNKSDSLEMENCREDILKLVLYLKAFTYWPSIHRNKKPFNDI
jgi:hypothetical protein